MELNIEQIQQDTELSVEFIYSVRIVNALSKINLNLDCDKNEAVKMIERTFEEYKDKISK